jgi:hypothetical protein
MLLLFVLLPVIQVQVVELGLNSQRSLRKAQPPEGMLGLLVLFAWIEAKAAEQP